LTVENIIVRHALSHRIRFEVPAMRHDDVAARKLEKCAESIDGILWVRANTLCAGFVVRFDPLLFSQSEVIELFRERVQQESS
jgi:hypothetical protein